MKILILGLILASCTVVKTPQKICKNDCEKISKLFSGKLTIQPGNNCVCTLKGEQE